jgi:hypothetical protein
VNHHVTSIRKTAIHAAFLLMAQYYGKAIIQLNDATVTSNDYAALSRRHSARMKGSPRSSEELSSAESAALPVPSSERLQPPVPSKPVIDPTHPWNQPGGGLRLFRNDQLTGVGLRFS